MLDTVTSTPINAKPLFGEVSDVQQNQEGKVFLEVGDMWLNTTWFVYLDT
nr:3976_t:CDS:2 [Entrophospora candida]